MSHGDEKDSSTSSVSSEFEIIDISAEPKKVIFGIDLGGTRTRVALMQTNEDNEDDFEPKVVKDIPSVVSFLKDGKCLVGWAAEKRTIASPLNTFYTIQRLIGRRYDDPVVQETMNRVGYKIVEHSDGNACLVSSNGNRVLTPAQIEALFLLKLKEFCEKEFDDIPMENIVISVPEYFNDDQKNAIKEAGLIAGLNVLAILSTPIAVLLAFAATNSERFHNDKTILVYDFGGSSFSVTVLKAVKGATQPEVISTEEDLFLGGEDFTKKLVDYLVAELKSKTGIDATICPTTMQYFRISAENAKIDLSYYTEVDVNFWGMQLHLPSRSSRIERISIKLTRNKFEELVAELINKTITLCHKALEKAKISVSDIDEIIAIGGTCRIPKVKSTIEEIFGKKPVDSRSNMNVDRVDVVAVSAALGGHILLTEISENLQEPPAPQINIPKLVNEDDVFDFTISDDVSQSREANMSNLLESHYMELYTEEQADGIVYKRCKPTEGNLPDDEDVSYIAVYERLIEVWRSKEWNKLLPQRIEDNFKSLKQKKDEFVEKQLVRLLPSPELTKWIFENELGL